MSLLNGEFPTPYAEPVQQPPKRKRTTSKRPATPLPQLLAAMHARYGYVPAFDLVLLESNKTKQLPIGSAKPAEALNLACAAAAIADLPVLLDSNKPATPTLQLKKAFLDAALDPKRLNQAHMHASAYAESCGILLESNKNRPPLKPITGTQSELRCLAYDAAYTFATAPSAKSYIKWQRAAFALDSNALRCSDALGSKSPGLHPTHPTFDPAARIVRIIPQGALDWQTHPAISLNPSAVHECAHSLRDLQLYPNKGI